MKFPRPTVYVAGPFRGDPEGNRERARQAAREVFRMGGYPVVPHNLSVGLDDMMTEAAWMALGLRILGHCDVIALAPGWEDSEGTLREFAAARKLGLAVWMLDGRRDAAA